MRDDDEGDDAHFAATSGATQRENLVNGSEQQSPGQAGGGANDSFECRRLSRRKLTGKQPVVYARCAVDGRSEDLIILLV